MLAMPVSSRGVNGFYEFGSFRLDPQKRLLLRDGEPVPLTPKTFETLLVLVQNSGQSISRDELMKMVWPDSFVEESNLTQNIFILRKALGSDKRYIVTLPGRGYQFVEPVREVEEKSGGESEAPAPETHSGEEAAGTAGRPRRSLPAALGMLALLVGAAIAGLLLYGGHNPRGQSSAIPTAGAAPPVPVRRSLAVLGFRNLSGRAQDQWLSTAFGEMLTTELAAGGKLRIVASEDVARARLESKLPNADSLSRLSLQRLRSQLGSDLVVLGSYTALPQKNGEEIRFDVRLQDTASGETIAAHSVTGSQAELFQLVVQAGTELRQTLGLAEPSTKQKSEIEASLGANAAATRWYAEGLDRLRSFDALRARDLLQKAVAADPGRAAFHSALAESWSELGYDLKAQAEAKKALQLSGNSSRREQLLVEGRYRELTGDVPAAIEDYQTLWNFYPDDLNYGLRLAEAQTNGGRGKDALQSVARMRRLPQPQGEDPRIDLAEAKAAESQSDYARDLQAATAAARRAQAQGSSLLLAQALHEKGYACMRLGRPDDALAAFEEARRLWAAAGDDFGVATALHMTAMTRYYRGDFEAAGRSFETALGVFRRIGAQEGIASCSHNYAMLLHDEGKLPQARQALEDALRIQRQLRDQRGVAADLDDIGNVQLAMGDLPGADHSKQQAIAGFHRLGNRFGEAIALGNLGEVLVAEGQLSRAEHNFQQALALKQQIGYKPGMAYSWMELAMIQEAQDRLQEAGTTVTQAINMWQQLGNEFDLAASRLQLAQINLDQGQASAAESLARAAGAVFDKHRVADSGAMAQATLGRALAAQGKGAAAEAASTRALALAEQGGDRQGRFQALLAAASAQLALGKRTEAARFLGTLLAEAGRDGYVPYVLEARLRLGELELRGGGKAGRGDLMRLQSEARGKGFLLIARQAGLALQGGARLP